MSAYQMWLYPQLQEAVEAQVLTLEQAWLFQDEVMRQPGELITLPAEWAPWVRNLEFFEMETPPGPPN